MAADRGRDPRRSLRLGWLIGGARSALIAGGFFLIVALTGWWDRSMITLYTVISAVALSLP